MTLRWKGELGDGHIHMTAHEYCEHKDREYMEAQKQQLRKIANNPILTEEVRKAIRYAVFRIDDAIWWRKQYEELKEQKERNEMHHGARI